MQSWRGTNVLDTALRNGEPIDYQSYATGLVTFAAAGIVFGVLSFLSCIGVSVARLLGCCCRPTKPIEEYTSRDKLLSLLGYMVFGVPCLICAAFGIVYLTTAAEVSTETVCSMESFRLASSDFFDSVFSPIQVLQTTTNETLSTIPALLRNASNNSLTLASIAEFDAFNSRLRTLSVAPNHQCYSCPVIATIGDATVAAMRTATTDAQTTIDSVVTTIEGGIVAPRVAIQASATTVADVRASIDNFVSGSWKTSNSQIYDAVKAQQGQIITLGGLFFGVSFLCIVMTLVGALVERLGKYTNCTGIKCIDELDDRLGAYLVWGAWMLTFLFSIVLFILAGVLLPIGVIASDACVVMENLPDQTDTYLGSVFPSSPGQLGPTTVLSGCFANNSILGSLNLTGSLTLPTPNYASVATINASAAFRADDLAFYRDLIWGLGPQNFTNWSPAAPAGTTTAINAVLAQLRTNYTGVETAVDDGVDHMFKTQGRITSIVAGVLDPILAAANTILTGGHCGFVRSHYNEVVGGLCGTMLPNLLLMALCCFLCGIFALPMIIFDLRLNKLLGGHGHGPKDSSIQPVSEDMYSAPDPDGMYGAPADKPADGDFGGRSSYVYEPSDQLQDDEV